MSNLARMDPYDIVPYESIAFPETHPAHLAILGRLFGLPAADPESCRVLELGCASGGNLIPMAWHLPGARFLGIDLSTAQIQRGLGLTKRLQLTNADLRQADILELDETLGTFDYIIAHGVYSWVPSPVREHLLRLASRLLAPAGLFYVSYNTLPGWRMRGMLRDILLYACRSADSAEDRIAATHAALQRLQSALQGLDSLSARYLTEEIDHLHQVHPSYLLFEYLAEHNQAFLFTEFASDAERSGLRYLSDTDLRTLFPSTYGSQVERALAPIEDGWQLEQWLDFITNRNFRQSVLCRADATVEDEIAIDLERFATLAFRCDLRPLKRPDLRKERPTPFSTPAGKRLDVSHPLTKAVIMMLAARFPDSLLIEDLMPLAVGEVSAAGGGTLASQVDACLAELFSLFAHGGLAAQPAPAHIPRPQMEKPRLSALTRAQVERGDNRVTTPHHTNLDLDAFAARLAMYLDGTRTIADVTQQLTQDLLSGSLAAPGDLRPREWSRQRIDARVRSATHDLVALFAHHGLLQASDERL